MKKFFNWIFKISYEKDLIGEWKRVYLFNKCIYGKMLYRYTYK